MTVVGPPGEPFVIEPVEAPAREAEPLPDVEPLPAPEPAPQKEPVPA